MNKNSISLSIIIPVYNTEKYIKDCVSSVVTQLDDKTEIIIVDDGSPDNSIKIINEFFFEAINNRQIKIYRQHNKGISAARNLGIKKASGEYITFVDSDDFILPDYIVSLKKIITEHHPDIIDFGFRRLFDSTLLGEESYTYNKFGLKRTKNIKKNIFGRSLWYPWARCFKKDLFNKVTYPVGVKFCEDLMTLPFLYDNSQSVFHIRKSLYAYRQNPLGATSQLSDCAFDNLEQFLNKITHKSNKPYILLKCNIIYCLYMIARRKNNKVTAFDAERSELKKNLFVYKYLNPKVAMILFSPNIFEICKKTKDSIWKRKI